MVLYLGHVIDGNGLHPLTDKIKPISAAPAPRFIDAVALFSVLI